MTRKPKRDLTIEDQLSRGPVDLPFLMLVLLLVGFGLIMVFSASYASAYYDSSKHNNPLCYITRQAVFAVLGLIVMWLVSRFNYEYLRALSFPLLVVSVVLLVLTLSPLGVTINRARRWLKMFIFFGPTYQPSEIAKIALILVFATCLCKRKPRRWKRLRGTRWEKCRECGHRLWISFKELIPYGAMLGVVALLVVKEPHMSGTILIIIGAAAVLFASGISWGWFLSGGAAIAGALAFIIQKTSYMTSRIEIWRDPWVDPLGKGFQNIQALLAMGSGGLLGLGLGQSKQKFLYIPEPENDFIFSIVVEELGFIGAALLLFLFAMLILRGYWLALHARDKFGTLVIVGIVTLLAAQVFFNIAVVTKMVPNTGISLPFFSYGGTALVMQLAEMGIILSISRQIPASRRD